MNNYIKILILLFLLCGLTITIKPHEPANYVYKKTPVEPLNITVPKSLKTNFKNGIDYCKTQNIAQNGAFETCILDYIYERNRAYYEIILKINTYCDKITTNECDRRNCVERIINQ
jgi:hypothetical protein